MDKKTKTILIIVAVVLLLIIAVAVYYYRQGKKTTTQAPITLDSPNSNNSYGVSASEISRISDALYRDMSGFNYLGHDAQPYMDLISLSDTDTERVYNDFNTKHQADSLQTLTGWINSESFAFNDVADAIRNRFGRLNLK
jgi:hypothetical protein